MPDNGGRPSDPAPARLPAISRRRLLASGAGLGAALLVPSPLSRSVEGSGPPTGSAYQFQPYCPIQRLGDIISQELPAPEESPLLLEPEIRRSVNGILQTTLRVQYAYKEVGDYRLYMRTYEGMIPGPTLRLQPGDVLRISLINDLPPNRDDEPAQLNHPHHFNTTNYHFHGSHVSPGGISDNILREMEPGESYDIEIALPSDHTRGTYWYHPHHHGSADIQVASGMAGMIVVDGDFAGVPEIATAKERVMVLGQAVFDALRTVENFETLFPEGSTRFFTINGQRYPTIAIRPGEVQRWRLLHAGYQDDIALTLDGHAFRVIAKDGISLSHLSDPLSTLVIVPGQRADVLVQAGEPGAYELHAVPNFQGYDSPTGPVARLVVAGDPMQMSLPSPLPAAPLSTIRDSELTGGRQVVFSAVTPENDAAGHWQEFSFLVDGKLFDATRVDHRIRLGSVEEWTLVNLHAHDHIFHIHTNPFQVTSINGQPLAEPEWRDTVILPRNGTLTFRSRFLDFTGRYVLHCHMMNHEDMGMMQLIEVY
ncbi:MAG TPA: multicopper oxidase family protein [Dehalococcoidia bacterium]|nr:multicopper oxidase family protein [Dehalococcoidia bacterium]